MLDKPLTVPEHLRYLAEIYADRNELYGDNYKNVGLIITLLLGKGIKLEGVDDVSRFVNYAQVVGKLMRYSAQYHNGGHEDSLDDLAVYAMMQQELDNVS